MRRAGAGAAAVVGAGAATAGHGSRKSASHRWHWARRGPRSGASNSRSPPTHVAAGTWRHLEHLHSGQGCPGVSKSMGTLLADHPVKAGAPGPVSLGSSKSTSMKYEVVVPSSCASAFLVEHFDPELVESRREAPTLGRRMSGTADSASKEPESDDERSDDGGLGERDAEPSDIERVEHTHTHT